MLKGLSAYAAVEKRRTFKYESNHTVCVVQWLHVDYVWLVMTPNFTTTVHVLGKAKSQEFVERFLNWEFVVNGRI